MVSVCVVCVTSCRHAALINELFLRCFEVKNEQFQEVTILFFWSSFKIQQKCFGWFRYPIFLWCRSCCVSFLGDVFFFL